MNKTKESFFFNKLIKIKIMNMKIKKKLFKNQDLDGKN